MNEALLAILSALVAALVWLVKTMNSRSDKLIEQRDEEVARLISSLEASVDAFKNFELESAMCFGKLVDRLDTSEQIQERVLVELKAMNAKLPTGS